MKKVISILAANLLLHVAFVAQTLTVYFKNGEYRLNEDSKEQLLNLIANSNVANSEWLVTGHTDDVGPETLNEKLSEQRALSVQEFLNNNGVENSATSVFFLGEKNPVASNDLPDGKQKNRRVDVVVQAKKSERSLSDFKITFKEFVIDPNKSNNLKLDNKGTVLHIPEHCFVDLHNNIIQDREVNIKYREYCNSADMAFSGIPMTYHENQQEYFFNSSGMFEIEGFYNDVPVHIAKGKSMTIDYALAKKNPDIAFFNLDNNTGEWTKIQEIQTAADEKIQQTAIETVELIREDPTLVLTEIGQTRLVGKRKGKDTNFGAPEVAFPTQPSPNDSRMLGGFIGADPGHSYPDVIRGLNVESFGVYNCDQIYRVKQPIAIKAHYEDKSGNRISDATILSMIDLNYNGAFSFDPTAFTCSAAGNNALVLFTKSGKIYLLESSDFKAMNISKGGSYTFKMNDMTDKIRNSKDLAEHLGL